MERTIEVTVANEEGFHARPAAEFVRLAKEFRAEVWLSKDDLEVNAKSIMGVLMLAAEQGSRLFVRAKGEDADEAAAALAAFISGDGRPR